MTSESDFNADRVYIGENVLIQRVDNESVLLDVKSGMYFGLDPVGTRCWELLAESGSIQKTVDGIVAEYEVEPERARNDLAILIQELSKNGLLKMPAE